LAIVLALVWAAPVRGGNPTYNDLVLADNPLFFWTFDEADGSAVNLAEPIPENDLIPQGNATRELHSQIGSGLLLGSTASLDGEDGIPDTLEASRFYAPDLRGDPTPGSNNDSPGYDFIESQLWAAEMWLQVTGENILGEADRRDYLLESFNGANRSNDPGLIYDFNADELEMFGSGRTGPGNGSTITDEDWHHVVFAFYGNDGGFGIADRQDIVIDGELFTDRSPGFSSGFGLRDFSLGATARNQSEAFEGRIDEVAIYDVGTMLLEQGLTIDVQNEEAEEAFEQFVLHLAESRMQAAVGTVLQPGDADQDLDFDQVDLVLVQQVAKYLTGQPATWGEGDWNAAPGGKPGQPPQGNGLFDQADIIAALSAGVYLTGPYAAEGAPSAAALADGVLADSVLAVNALAVGGGDSRAADSGPLPVPEPAAGWLAVCGLLGAGLGRRLRRP
jgi:hypothetical protein